MPSKSAICAVVVSGATLCPAIAANASSGTTATISSPSPFSNVTTVVSDSSPSGGPGGPPIWNASNPFSHVALGTRDAAPSAAGSEPNPFSHVTSGIRDADPSAHEGASGRNESGSVLANLSMIINEASVEPRGVMDGTAQCCVAAAGSCCPGGTMCYPPYGCVSQPAAAAPVSQAAASGQESGSTAHLGAGSGPMGFIIVVILATSCLCLCLLACLAKQCCECMFNPGQDGEWSGAQMGMAGLAGAAAGYELEQMMDGYGGRYGGGYGYGGYGGAGW